MDQNKLQFHISIRKILRLILNSLFILIGVITITIVISFVVGEGVYLNEFFFNTGLLIFIFTIIPYIIIYLDYFISNYKWKLDFDLVNRKIIITRGDNTFQYNFEDIKTSKVYLPLPMKTFVENNLIQYSDKIDFGYWYIRTCDGKKFFLTSLLMGRDNMVKIVLNFFKEMTEFNYMYFYTIKRNEYSKEELSKQFEIEIDRYFEKYNHLSKKQVEDMIENENAYQPAAIEACKRIISKRSKINEC